jgi:TolB-like protein
MRRCLRARFGQALLAVFGPLAVLLAQPLVALPLAAQSAPPAATTAATPAQATRPTVAVLAFDNRSGRPDYDALGQGLAAMMTTDLATVKELRVVERERLADITREIDAQRSARFDSTTAVRVGRLAGAQFLVTGSLAAVDPQLRLDTRVIRVETGVIVKTAQVTGRVEAFLDLQQRLVKQLVRDLDIALSPEREAQLDARVANNGIGDLESAVRVSNAMNLADAGDFGSATLEIAPVVAKYPNSTFVKLTADEIAKRAKAAGQEKAKAETRDAINAGVKKGIGGLLKRKKPPL